MFLWFFLECNIYSLLKSTCDTIFRFFFLCIVLGLLAKLYSHVTTTAIKIQNSSITPRNSWLLHFYSTSAPTPRLCKQKSVFCSYNCVFFRVSFNWNPILCRTSLVAQTVKSLSTMWETRVQSLGWEDPLEKEMAIHSSTIAWKIPWTEEPGRLQPMGSQRVGHDWVTLPYLTLHIS